MIAAVIGRGLRDQRRSALGWGGSLAAMSGLMAVMWPSIEGSMETLMDSYPQGLKEAFNIETIASVETYVDAEMLSLIVPLAVAYLAVRIVAGMICGAEERGHLDVLLATPLTRRALAAGAALTAAAVVAAVLAATAAITWLAATIVGADPSLAVLARGFANAWPLALLFAGLAVLLSGIGAPVTGIATATLAGMYVIDLVGKLADPVEPLRAVSAFKYYGSAVQNGIDPPAFAGLGLTGVLLAITGAALLERRDLR